MRRSIAALPLGLAISGCLNARALMRSVNLRMHGDSFLSFSNQKEKISMIGCLSISRSLLTYKRTRVRPILLRYFHELSRVLAIAFTHVFPTGVTVYANICAKISSDNLNLCLYSRETEFITKISQFYIFLFCMLYN